jgi:hypothetical protein
MSPQWVIRPRGDFESPAAPPFPHRFLQTHAPLRCTCHSGHATLLFVERVGGRQCLERLALPAGKRVNISEVHEPISVVPQEISCRDGLDCSLGELDGLLVTRRSGIPIAHAFGDLCR